MPRRYKFEERYAMKLKDDFSFAANKIVSCTEFSEQLRTLCRKELSTGEKLYRTFVDKPLTAVASVALAVKLKLTDDMIPGCYKDFFGKVYMSSEFANVSTRAIAPFMPENAIQRKIADLEVRAFAACEDRSGAKAVLGFKEV